MKKYSIIFASFFAILVFAGCKKTLEEKPVTFISPSSYFSNAQSYQSAVLGVYSDLGGLYQSNTYMLLEMCTDIYGQPSPSFEQALPMWQNAPNPVYYNTIDAWGSGYTLIKDANFILDNLAGATIDATSKSQLTAEARFLRAYAYFYLVQLYGDIPLRTTTIENYSQVQIPRTGQDSVYNFILGDLTYAEANLPAAAPQQGRVYQLVATALLSKVYLTMAGYPLQQRQYFQNARDKALTVINSGNFQLQNDYASVFHNLAYTTESIWEQLYVQAKGGNPLHSISCPASQYNAILLPATWFINSFSPGDARSTWGIQQNYKDPNNNTLPPFFQKFVNTSAIDQGIGPSASGLAPLTYFSLPYLRLAEMYLIAAEAENELNGPANAYQYINKIRERARVNKYDPTNVPDLAGLTEDQFRDSVWMERKHELSQEGSSWFDLKRTNTFGNIQNVRGSQLINPVGAYNSTWLIPYTEFVANNIPQNPSY
ncbi:MAG: RagB/SusD family nutrient uptake outer membrane protein [Bacteroidetes bacterium]|nr:RagB/SusD family nutrient uptake outer membrane protein [Bacteroidota bacterium]